MATDCEPSCVAYHAKKEPNNQLRIPAPEDGGIETQRLQADSLYGSLNPLKTWQIRILELRPRSEQSGLVGRLFNAAMLDGGGIVDLETKTWRDFFAISYFWGEDQTPRFRMDCSGLPYLLQIEAYRALIRVRDEASPVYLWIDTLCINQHDVQEKSVQVAKMRSIYHSAAWVLAYLGEPEACADDSGLDGEAVDFVFGLLNDYEDFHRLKPSEQAAGSCTVTERLKGCDTSEWPFCDRHATLLERGVHV
ncbi:hypothetical protein M409DRAFT_29870 [Zasmidium cellare ATCC 36951]|uniref:Heterokaryon incompatibility domain-containing protein n=1 Tax=Zasmidium cellare ATCC 36951 TaxID=1080233 RepID=A0A6A6C0M6_ZASCE|nr:uncharacterized protein M409DRAFT_29870 [Zasmidium cellare ATCC 36951]KAF2159710.1 hypothetical protein M409DRAFT_29870 [Zasmidium cellare ATCC 36951]